MRQCIHFAVPLPVADPVFTSMDLRDVYVDLVDPLGMPFRDSIHNTFNASAMSNEWTAHPRQIRIRLRLYSIKSAMRFEPVSTVRRARW